MNTMELSKEGNVFILTMTDEVNNNTLSSETLKEYNDTFDTIEETPGNAALIIRSSHQKMWCNGINLQWYSEQTHEERVKFLEEMKRTMLRASLLNLPTIGCLSGHAYAGGAILASSLDFRIMREDRAKFCFPEVNYAMLLGDTLYGVINNLPNKYAVQQLVLTGAAWKGEECLANGVVNSIHSEEELFDKTMEFAKEMALKVRDNYTGLKYDVRKSLKEMWDSGTII